MGEVFRAHDSRLGRDVALKLLPPSSVTDPVSRARFDREARVLASLNHPNIAQIFGIESHGDAPVIVMEVVDGPTLAERLAKGAMPLGAALPLALQICDGLEAAHERGILHRDLKPANVKVRTDGAVKILDFGLARALAQEQDRSEASTIAGATTDAGIVMGTPSYMSPEQARGEPVDRRADIWAFGCVLYEMLAGARAFAGHSSAEIFANVVHEDPDWAKLPGETPARVVELLKRCLQKPVKDRLRDIGDARYEIARAIESPRDRAANVPQPAGRSLLHSLAWFGAGAVAALAAGLLALPAIRGAEDPPPAYRTEVTLPADTTLALSRGSAVAVSPDGRWLAFTARAGSRTLLYLRAFDRFDAQPLPGTEDAQNPFFSPDSRWIGFFTTDKLKRVSVDGGAPVTVTDVANPRGEAWGPADQIAFVHSNNVAISRVGITGGKPERWTTLQDGERAHRWPRFLPGGGLLYSIWNDVGWEPARIALRQPDGTQRLLLDGGGYPRYVPGYLIYARSEGLMAVKFDEASGVVSGQPAPVVDGVITNASGGAHFDVSANGTLAYVPGGFLETLRTLSWVDLNGKATHALDLQQGMGFAWRLSPDGRRVVRNNTVGNRHNWIEDLAARTSRRMPNAHSGFVSNPIWSGDGAWIAFSVDTPVLNIYRQSTDDRAVLERLTESPHQQAPRDISRDGRYLFYTEFDPSTAADIWMLTLPSGAPGSAAVTPASLERKPLVNTSAIENYPTLSPDGKWLAYQSNDSGRFEVFVRPFPANDRTFRVSTDGGISPVWAPKSDALLFRDAAGRMRSAALADVLTGAPPNARVLFDATGYESAFSIAPDGSRLLMMPSVEAERTPRTINVIFNFLDELRRRIQ